MSTDAPSGWSGKCDTIAFTNAFMLGAKSSIYRAFLRDRLPDLCKSARESMAASYVAVRLETQDALLEETLKSTVTQPNSGLLC